MKNKIKLDKNQIIKISIGASAILFLVVTLALSLTLCKKKPKEPTRSEVFLADPEHNISVLVDGEIKQMNIEDYIMGVVAKEMPLSFDAQALKAQAVAARTYTIRKMFDGGCGRQGADICSDHTHCQAYTQDIPEEYRDKVYGSVMETTGEILEYDNYPIKAMYHSTSGGKTEYNENVFGNAVPYLVSVDSPGEEKYKTFRMETRVDVQTAKEKVVNAKGKLTKQTISIQSRFDSGRVNIADLFGHYFTGRDVRTMFNLPSTNFEVRKEGEVYIFTTFGYGHGVGMSQVGADSMANSGDDYSKILLHYYTGVNLEKLY